MTKKEELRKLEMSLDYFKGYQFATDKAVELRKDIENEATHANHIMHSDVNPYEIIERKTKKSILIRRMDSELNDNWKPDTVIGGFVGHTQNNYSQEWTITSNEKHIPFIIRKHKDGQWYSKNGAKFRLSDSPCKFYDYNF